MRAEAQAAAGQPWMAEGLDLKGTPRRFSPKTTVERSELCMVMNRINHQYRRGRRRLAREIRIRRSIDLFHDLSRSTVSVFAPGSTILITARPDADRLDKQRT